ncbi:MAG: hypothetical protein ACTSWX_04155 [Promethearchaeota archaeon]
MPPTKKSTKKKRTSTRRSNWKNLQRDSRGRWVKAKTTKKTTTTAVKGKGTPKKVKKKQIETSTEQKKATNVLNQMKQNFNTECPRCGGDLKHFRIRCGPDRLVSVKKCNICNYWIPLAEK